MSLFNVFLTGVVSNFMLCGLFNIKGWKKMISLFFLTLVAFLGDLVLTNLCLDVLIHTIILYALFLFYIIIIYEAALYTGIDKKTANLMCFLYFACAWLVLCLTILPYLGLAKFYGYIVIFFDIFCRHVMFAL